MSKISTIVNAYRENNITTFLRFLLLKEREKRLSFLDRLRAWYHKQLLLAECTRVGSGLEIVSNKPMSFVGPGGELILGENVILNSACRLVVTTHINKRAKLVIGDRVRIGRYTSIRAAHSITIRNDCLIAAHVRIYDYNGHTIQPFDHGDPSKKRNNMEVPHNEVRPIIIEENVWIAENAFIQAGVRIGANSIIAANSVVTKNIPPNVIAFGMPARPIFWLDKSRGEKK
jgi:acetyltransferase-like isoleucine patch superfamily enzyme